MNQHFRALLDKLSWGKISKEEFIRIYYQGSPPNENDCLELLHKGIANRDRDLTEDAIFIISVMDFKSETFTKDLCELLLADWHTKHERIADLLRDIKDPRSVESLYKAGTLRFNYLEYDDTEQFARKCIKALSSIRNFESMERLKLLSQNKNPEIAKYAIKELNYINNG